MGYRETFKDAGFMLPETLRRVGDFNGRSRRLEVAHYWVGYMLLGIGMNTILGPLVSGDTILWLFVFYQCVFLVPMLALFVRRLHDQDRTGGWVALIPLSIFVSVLRVLAVDRGTLVQTVFALVGFAVAVLIFILCVLPGTVGPNSYGPDPRFEEG